VTRNHSEELTEWTQIDWTFLSWRSWRLVSLIRLEKVTRLCGYEAFTSSVLPVRRGQNRRFSSVKEGRLL
jgi:hypothetical protein